MFLEHIAYHLDKDGRAAVLLPHGVLFRGNKEETIRRYLIENQNVIDAIIGLPANCFHGTSIPVCCIVLKRTGTVTAAMFGSAMQANITQRERI